MAVLGNCVKFADLGQLVDPVRLPADGAGGFLPSISPKTQRERHWPEGGPQGCAEGRWVGRWPWGPS
jgi:hypothetical protein